jgi:hypothetical protein
VSRLDNVVECFLHPSKPATEGVRRRIASSKYDLARKSGCTERPPRHTAFDKLCREVARCQKKTGNSVTAQLVVRELWPNRPRVVVRCSQHPVTAETINCYGIDRTNNLESISATEGKIGQAQQRDITSVGCPVIGLLIAANQTYPHLLHGVGVTQRCVGQTSSHQEVYDDRPAEQLSCSWVRR